MVGAQGLVEGVTGGGSIVSDVRIVHVRSGHTQEQRRDRAVERLYPGSSDDWIILVILIWLGTPIRGPVGGVLRGVCRVFVNVCEVREWSGPSVAA